mmetsp:Transcript_13891/g.17235  ORF Transcript_13891/g.17235 Transcript_13891/m.17235 type:complete len:89 (+) Transcript_13891:368-634(+)
MYERTSKFDGKWLRRFVSKNFKSSECIRWDNIGDLTRNVPKTRLHEALKLQQQINEYQERKANQAIDNGEPVSVPQVQRFRSLKTDFV